MRLLGTATRLAHTVLFIYILGAYFGNCSSEVINNRSRSRNRTWSLALLVGAGAAVASHKPEQEPELELDSVPVSVVH